MCKILLSSPAIFDQKRTNQISIQQKSSMVLLLFWVGVSSHGPATDQVYDTCRKPTVESGAEIEKYQIRPRGIFVGNAALMGQLLLVVTS